MDRQASAEHPKMTDDPRPDEKAAEPDTPIRRYADTPIRIPCSVFSIVLLLLLVLLVFLEY